MRRSLVSIGILVLPTVLCAQPAPDSLTPTAGAVDETLERILDQQDREGQPTGIDIADTLTRLALHPLRINTASATDLGALPHVSPLLAQRIVAHRERNGPFADLQSVTAVDGIDRSLLRRLDPYLTVHDPQDANASSDAAVGNGSETKNDESFFSSIGLMPSDFDVEIMQRATRRLDLGRGYADDTSRTTFEGPPGGLTTRIQFQYGQHAGAALTLDKDPGEPLTWSPQSHQYGFDHVAGNVALHNIGPLETVVVGDYSAQFGQGVTLWRGLHFGKGRDPVSPLLRSGRGLVPFQSASEHRFFRGVGATARVASPVSVSAFYSRRQRDATLASDTTNAEGTVPARTLSTSGRHRTPTERQRRNNFGVTTVGGALEYETSSLRLGITGYKSRFNRPLEPRDSPHRRFYLSGTGTHMIGAFGRTVLDQYTLFGEVARAENGQYGGVAGATLRRGDRLQALLMGRHYPRAFAGLYNAGPGESSRTQNETGFYAGLRLQVAPRWRVAAYVDQYQFPWLRFGVPQPSRGLDTRAIIEHDPRPWLSSYLQVKVEREKNGSNTLGPGNRRLASLATETRQSARLHTEYDFSDALTLRTRFELSRVAGADNDASRGVLFYQGLRLRLLKSLQFDARITFFDTDDYAARIYTYEHDLLYSFSVPALHGEGKRSYALIRYEPQSSLTIEAKYGVTWFPRRDTVGSGLAQTDSNMRREVRLQVRWTLD